VQARRFAGDVGVLAAADGWAGAVGRSGAVRDPGHAGGSAGCAMRDSGGAVRDRRGTVEDPGGAVDDSRGAWADPGGAVRSTGAAARRGRVGLGLLAAALALAAGVVHLDTVPAPFWDEGWTLLTARNWVERGHYGQLLDGRPRGPGLSADLPVVAPIAASFRVLGVGFWQGRLVTVVFTAGAVAVMWGLTRMLEGPAVGRATVLALVLLTYPDPLTVGRHAVAEMPALFYLLAGYALAWPALRGRWLALAPAALAWALALATKAQVTPFWLISIACALGMAIARRWPAAAARLALLAAGAWTGRSAIAWLYRALPRGPAEAPLEGLYAVSGAVLAGPARAAAARLLLTCAGLALLGLACGGWRLARDARDPDTAREPAVLRAALWSLAASWLLWFAALAPAWPRYLFPAAFLAGPFVGRLLVDVTGGLRRGDLARGARGGLTGSRPAAARARAAALAVVLALALANGLRTVTEHVVAHRERGGRAVEAAAEFLNRQTAPNARIETYDSELMFLLARRYHYPPDQVHVELNRRLFLDARTPVAYDPLAADPDYLVAGPLPRLWRLYDPVVRTPAFRPVARFGDYLVYERVRR